MLSVALLVPCYSAQPCLVRLQTHTKRARSQVPQECTVGEIRDTYLEYNWHAKR